MEATCSRDYLGIEPEPCDDFNAAESLICKQIIETLDEISGLDAVEADVSLRDFSETFQHWLERSTIVETDKNVSWRRRVERQRRSRD